MNPIGAGLLTAFGNVGLGVGNAFDAARKEALERDRLEQDRSLRQQALDAQIQEMAQRQRQFEVTQAAAERDKYVQPSDIAAMYSHLGLTPPPAAMGPSSARIPAAWAPAMLSQAAEQQKVAREQAAREGQAMALERLGAGSPGTPAVEPPDEGAMYSAGTPATAATPANPRYQAIAGLLRQGPLSDYLIKALDVENEKPLLVSDTTRGYMKNGNYTPLPGVVDKPDTQTVSQATAQGVFAVTVDKRNGQEISRVKIGDNVPHAPREPAQPTASVTIDNLMREYQTIKRQNPNDPRLADLDQRIQGQRFTMIPPGGAPWSVASQTPGPQNPIQPSGAERSAQADMRTGIGTLDTLIADVAANKGVLGNLASNPTGATRRGLSDYVPSMTTPEEKKFLATLSYQVAEIKRAFVGAAQTDSELKGMLDLLPDKGQVDVNVLPRLEAIRDYTRRKYVEHQAPFQEPGRPGAPKKRIRLDAQGNPIP